MNKLTIALVAGIFLMSSQPFAADANCEAQAADKKLAGAAKSSFIKKCTKDASAARPTAACDAKAGEKKLHGAARTSFMKKCEKDGAAK